MAKDFHLPDLGSGLQEGALIAWHVAVGEEVTEGAVLCEIETEKAVVEIPVPFSGVIASLSVDPGDKVPVGGLLCTIGQTQEIAEVGSPAASVSASPPVSGFENPSASPQSRPAAMPLVRKLARDYGIDLADVSGSGVGGRIVRKDLEVVIAARHIESNGSDVSVAPERPPGGVEDQRIKLSSTRRAIAAHMSAQWQSVPHITGHAEAEASRFLEARQRFQERLGQPVPYEAMFVAASVPALARFPEMNAELAGDELILNTRRDVGFAVATDEGLVVPVIRDADKLELGGLVNAVSDLIERARDRRLRPGEMGDQTFTISNIGPAGADHVTQILPAGTTAIVSFGRVREQAIVTRDGAISAAPMMAISGTWDHRVVDGAPAMQFLHSIIEIVEEPALLLLSHEVTGG